MVATRKDCGSGAAKGLEEVAKVGDYVGVYTKNTGAAGSIVEDLVGRDGGRQGRRGRRGSRH